MPESPVRQLKFGEALREATDLCMARDPRVIVMGEGVPDPKSIFKTTEGLREKYGPARVFDTPLSENGITGVCIGAALTGMRPILVHQRIDFALLSMDQLVNNAAKWHYMFGGVSSVPMVIRMIIGRGWGQGPQHSQGLQAMFAQVPGLKVVMPTSPHDAKGLLIAAVEDDNPVVFIEHRWLHNVSGDVPEGTYSVPIGLARKMHDGADLTIAAFSYMTLESLKAAQALLTHVGVGVDLIDMRSLRPLDSQAVMDSIAKTGRLLVADPAFKTGSFATEIMSIAMEEGFHFLKTAPKRVTLPDHPVPTSHLLSNGYYPSPMHIAQTALQMLGHTLTATERQALDAALEPRAVHDVPDISFQGPF
jgi:pyruvate dehydrogenase E1 component beta subunit